ncbi:MAG: aminotransferase class IV, partial [Bradymonadaceae bacterium]
MSLPEDDRGFLYGDGLFETVRVENGSIRWLDRHIDRLRSSGKALGFPEEIIDDGCACLESLVDEDPGIWRVTVTRPGQGVAFGGSGHVSIRHRPLQPIHRPTLTLAHGFFHPGDVLARHKTTSFIRYVEARRRANEAGFDNAVLTS